VPVDAVNSSSAAATRRHIAAMACSDNAALQLSWRDAVGKPVVANSTEALLALLSELAGISRGGEPTIVRKGG